MDIPGKRKYGWLKGDTEEQIQRHIDADVALHEEG